jgi:hypothetical protein
MASPDVESLAALMRSLLEEVPQLSEHELGGEVIDWVGFDYTLRATIDTEGNVGLSLLPVELMTQPPARQPRAP